MDVHEGRLIDGGMHNKALDELLRTLDGRQSKFLALRRIVKPRQIAVYGGFVP